MSFSNSKVFAKNKNPSWFESKKLALLQTLFFVLKLLWAFFKHFLPSGVPSNAQLSTSQILYMRHFACKVSFLSGDCLDLGNPAQTSMKHHVQSHDQGVGKLLKIFYLPPVCQQRKNPQTQIFATKKGLKVLWNGISNENLYLAVFGGMANLSEVQHLWRNVNCKK